MFAEKCKKGKKETIVFVWAALNKKIRKKKNTNNTKQSKQRCLLFLR
jgi:hypothetical protein